MFFKKMSAVISLFVFQFIQAFGQQSTDNEIRLTTEELTLIFSISTAVVIGIFLYLARDIILRRKGTYEKGKFESQKDRDYEKYHSDWTSDDFTYQGKKEKADYEDEFKKLSKNSELPNYYNILGIQKTATQNEIKNQFRKLVKEWHPDKNKDPETEKKMAEINKAYEILSDKEKKEKYDKYFA